MTELIFGAFVPQGWKTELIDIVDPRAKWRTAVDVALRAEALGYDSIWVYDHMHNVPKPVHETVFECWTMVAALSQITNRVRLGQMVGCNSYRNPALLAKMTATIDVISGGRLDWGIGAGWYEHEYRAYGYEFPAPKVRIGQLREAVEIVKAMWTQPDAHYDGRYFTVAGAQCDPKPLQSPHPPIWIGGAGEQLTLRVVARHATHSNFGGTPEEFARKRDILHHHCTEVGRDPADITLTWSPELFIRETEAEVRAEGRSLVGLPFEKWSESNLIGTPEQVAERLQTYLDLGVGGLVSWCADLPSTQTLELFATKVMPAFR